LSAVYENLYGEVSGINSVGVFYEPSWKDDTTGEAIRNRLKARFEADIAQGCTVSGVHRDRYVFTRHTLDNGHNCDFSEMASTGQRRILALLLRVAQARCFSSVTGKTPVLLLDDVLLELDGEKRRRFLSVMPEYEQAFFTFLPEEPYEKYQNSDTFVYSVREGTVRALK
jgi:DNA replication and repair protein RecF